MDGVVVIASKKIMGILKRLPYDYVELVLLSIATVIGLRILYISLRNGQSLNIQKFFKILYIGYIFCYFISIFCKLFVLFVRDYLTIYWSLVLTYYIMYVLSLLIFTLTVYGRLRYTFVGMSFYTLFFLFTDCQIIINKNISEILIYTKRNTTSFFKSNIKFYNWYNNFYWILWNFCINNNFVFN